MIERCNIIVVGLGYVGMSLALLWARQHSITAWDTNEARVALVDAGRPTVADDLMSEYMASEKRSLSLPLTKRG